MYDWSCIWLYFRNFFGCCGMMDCGVVGVEVEKLVRKFRSRLGKRVDCIIVVFVEIVGS